MLLLAVTFLNSCLKLKFVLKYDPYGLCLKFKLII